MYLIVTRSFPPELGGMQSLMWGLAREMSKNFMIKVFADYKDGHKDFDEQANFSIERVGGIKFLRKIRKSQLIDEFIKENKVKYLKAHNGVSFDLTILIRNANRAGISDPIGRLEEAGISGLIDPIRFIHPPASQPASTRSLISCTQ